MWFDLRDAVRSLARDRGFASLAIVLLASTAGATTAVYAVVNAVVLQPRVFGAEDRTVVIWQRDSTRSTPVVEIALGEIESWRASARSFEALAAFGSVNSDITLIEGDARTRAPSSFVSAAFFDVVGVRPALGRAFTTEDEAARTPSAAIISNELWQREFGGDVTVVGRRIRVQRGVGLEHSVEVAGVMPPGFDFPRGVDVWLPAAPVMREAARPDPANPAHVDWYLAHYRVFYAVGRLRRDVTIAAAEEELGRVVRDLGRGSPAGAATAAVVTSIDDYLLGPAKNVLWLMFAGGGLMVLLACSSVAGLHLFRSARHDRAIAIQLALGASRVRLIRRSLLESGLLGVGAGIGALATAWLITRGLVVMAPLDVQRLGTAHVDAPSVLAVLVGLATLTSVFTGAAPALFIRQVDTAATLTAGARAAMQPRQRRIQRIVVGWQIAIAIVLLSGAALFLRSVQHLDRTPLGFSPDNLLSVDLSPSGRELEQWDQFYDRVRARIEAAPQVVSTGAVSLRPLSGPVGNDTIPVLRGQEGLGPDAPWRTNPRANLQAVTPGYFRTLGTRLLGGRDFTSADRAADPNVVIVSASAAQRYWAGRDPVGQQILVATQRAPGTMENPRFQTVVGVVEDVRYRGIMDPRLDIYMPAAQSTIRVKQLLVRTTVPPAQLGADLRAIAREVDPRAWAGEAMTMTDAIARETAPWRFATRVLSAFGILAGVLAAVGLVAQVSLVVTLRRRELGIRAALGATPARLHIEVLTDVFWTGVTAAAIGVAAALAGGRYIGGLLVETRPDDPVSIGGAAMLTLAAGLAACTVPAAAAARRDPADVLRD